MNRRATRDGFVDAAATTEIVPGRFVRRVRRVSLRSFDGRVGVRGVDEGVVTSMMWEGFIRGRVTQRPSPRVVDFCFGENEETFVLTLRARD